MTTKDVWERILLIRVTPYQQRKISLLKASPEVQDCLKYIYTPRTSRIAKFKYDGPFGDDDGSVFIDESYFQMLPHNFQTLYQVFKELCVGKTKEFSKIITCLARKDLELGLTPKTIAEHFPHLIQKIGFMSPTTLAPADYEGLLPCYAMLPPPNSVRVIYKDDTFFTVKSVLDTEFSLPACRFALEGYIYRADGGTFGVGRAVTISDGDDDDGGLIFQVSDVVDMAAPFSKRLEWLRDWSITYGVPRVRYELLTEAAQIEQFCRRVDKSNSFTSALFKTADSPYVTEKSKWWKAYQKSYTTTVKVVGTYTTPRTGNVNLIVEFEGRTCKLTGHNSEAQSEAWRRDPDAVIGKSIIVSYSGLTSNGALKNSQFRGMAD